MATPESATGMTPLEYLKQADQEMAAGNGQVAAGLLWKATEATFIGLAEKLGMDGNDLREVAKAMEKKNPPYVLYYSGNLLFAESLRDHASTDPMEGYELEYYVLEDFLDGVREFILEQHGQAE